MLEEKFETETEKKQQRPEGSRPPNLRNSSDYTREPTAPRCFNCAYLRDENLDFYCSKFSTAVKVYELCDAWKQNENPLVFPISPNLVELRVSEAKKHLDPKPMLVSNKEK